MYSSCVLSLLLGGGGEIHCVGSEQLIGTCKSCVAHTLKELFTCIRFLLSKNSMVEMWGVVPIHCPGSALMLLLEYM